MKGPITIVVPGRPVPKGRPRVVRGHAYTPAATVVAEHRIAFLARAVGARPIECPVAVRAEFFFKDGRARADIDNLAKLVLDALNGVAFKDDRQVVSLEATIYRGQKDLSVVTITPIAEELLWKT